MHKMHHRGDWTVKKYGTPVITEKCSVFAISYFITTRNNALATFGHTCKTTIKLCPLLQCTCRLHVLNTIMTKIHRDVDYWFVSPCWLYPIPRLLIVQTWISWLRALRFRVVLWKFWVVYKIRQFFFTSFDSLLSSVTHLRTPQST